MTVEQYIENVFKKVYDNKYFYKVPFNQIKDELSKLKECSNLIYDSRYTIVVNRILYLEKDLPADLKIGIEFLNDTEFISDAEFVTIRSFDEFMEAFKNKHIIVVVHFEHEQKQFSSSFQSSKYQIAFLTGLCIAINDYLNELTKGGK